MHPPYVLLFRLDTKPIRSYIVAQTTTRCALSSDTAVGARIDGQVKEKAAKVLADMGLSVSDAIRLLLVRVAAEKALPFALKVPNAETQAAMAELERGEGAAFDGVAELIADLNAELNV